MTLWVDASSGASGDMLLGALLGAGVPLETLQGAVDAVVPEPVTFHVEQVTRNGFAATRCHVEVADSTTYRTWRDIRTLIARAEQHVAAGAGGGVDPEGHAWSRGAALRATRAAKTPAP